MNSILKNSLSNSLSYQEYRNLVTTLFTNGRVTGLEQLESLLHYTKLNEARMNRLDKTMKVVDYVKLNLINLDKKYTWLVISESWCGDAAQILPILNKMSEVTDNVNLRIVLRDENSDLMNQFLTNGSKSIPIVIILEEDLKVINTFGPRPNVAKTIVEEYKLKNGSIDETLKIELQKWYLADKGTSTQKEIVELM